MFSWSKEMFSWIPNACIKFPITQAGLGAAEKAVKAGMRVNLTLCFSQEQAAAVYAATLGAKKARFLFLHSWGDLTTEAKTAWI